VRAESTVHRAENRGQRAESRKQRAESREQKAQCIGHRAENREQRGEGRGQRAESREQRAKGREQRAESREHRVEGRGQRTEGREQRAESREQRAESRGQRAEGRGQKPSSYFLCQPWPQPLISDPSLWCVWSVGGERSVQMSWEGGPRKGKRVQVTTPAERMLRGASKKRASKIIANRSGQPTAEDSVCMQNRIIFAEKSNLTGEIEERQLQLLEGEQRPWNPDRKQ
jgi:hypothetical protein